MKKVLFVCTGYTCRSPMARANFGSLAEDGGLRFRTESGGAEALEGTAIVENAAAALEGGGDLPGLHSARW